MDKLQNMFVNMANAERLSTDASAKYPITRSPGTTIVCFFVIFVNDVYGKPQFKIKRRG